MSKDINLLLLITLLWSPVTAISEIVFLDIKSSQVANLHANQEFHLHAAANVNDLGVFDQGLYKSYFIVAPDEATFDVETGE